MPQVQQYCLVAAKNAATMGVLDVSALISPASLLAVQVASKLTGDTRTPSRGGCYFVSISIVFLTRP